MLRLVKEFYITNTKTISAILDDKEYNLEEKLILFANEIMDYTLRYPGITILLREAVDLEEKDEISKKIIKITTNMHQKMDEVLYDYLQCSRAEHKYKKMIFLSSIIYPIENYDIIDFDKKTLANEDSRIEYIKKLLKIIKKV